MKRRILQIYHCMGNGYNSIWNCQALVWMIPFLAWPIGSDSLEWWDCLRIAILSLLHVLPTQTKDALCSAQDFGRGQRVIENHSSSSIRGIILPSLMRWFIKWCVKAHFCSEKSLFCFLTLLPVLLITLNCLSWWSATWAWRSPSHFTRTSPDPLLLLALSSPPLLSQKVQQLSERHLSLCFRTLFSKSSLITLDYLGDDPIQSPYFPNTSSTLPSTTLLQLRNENCVSVLTPSWFLV